MSLLRRTLGTTGGRVVLIAALFYLVYVAWLALQAPGKIAPPVWESFDPEGETAVEVELGFPPERFHILAIQEHGRIRRTRENVVEVRAITAEGIRELARKYWVRAIRPLEAVTEGSGT